MADFNKAIGKTLTREGGSRYTDDPNDRGGATKYGICQRSYPNLDIADLTEKQACDIYKRDFWDRIQGDEMKSQLIAENIFDTSVNMGVRTASRLAQLALDVDPTDGVIGSKSLEALNNADEGFFISQYTIAKIARYAHICNRDKSQQKYLLGWLNRALGGTT